MSSFSHSFTHKAMFLIWNHGLICYSNSRWEPWISYTRVVYDF